jgi:UDP-N-acetylglucosamine 1-carboxyvinyltransferase
MAPGRLLIAANKLQESDIDELLGQQIRHTLAFAAAVLSRKGRVSFPLPGGDGFCERPVDLHLEAMRRAGARVEERGGVVRVTLSSPLPRAFEINLGTRHGPSLGATITALLLASRAAGVSVLAEPSVEPEVEHVVRFLRRAGGCALWRDGRLVVRGVPDLAGTTYHVPPDRMEAGTLLIAAAATGGSVSLGDIRLADLTPGFLTWLAHLGAGFRETEDGVVLDVAGRLLPRDVVTGPHPAFPTDLQPQATALLTALPGQVTVIERVHPRRSSHVAGLTAFGASIRHDADSLVVTGTTRLRGAKVAGGDIRCVAALLIAALAAEGESHIGGIDHLQRGYVDLPGKLAALGAGVETVRVGTAPDCPSTGPDRFGFAAPAEGGSPLDTPPLTVSSPTTDAGARRQ